MIDLTLPVLASVAGASFLAGALDAIVGGGGLVLLPALFAAFPAAPPPTLLGTNKGGAIWGTAWAARQYIRRVDMPWARLAPAVGMALLGAFLGAWAVTHVPADGLKRVLPFVLLAVLAYTLWRRDLGREHRPLASGRAETLGAAAIGGVVGVYDGFFGPGTGSFFVFLFVRLLGWDFLRASAGAKLLNTATNAAALLLFGLKGHVWWHIAAVLAVANLAGSLLGTRLALKHGAGFVRGVFVVVVGALILKTFHDAYLR